MMRVEYRRGVFLPDLRLALDPADLAPFAFVSHAHSDHTGRHPELIVSEMTHRLMVARLGDWEARRHVMPWLTKQAFPNFTAALLPAGHILGSAQLWLETELGTLLYTGDFKLRSGRSSETAHAWKAQTLIMETTYGLPKYRFPPAAEVIGRIVQFCGDALEDGMVPVLLGYSLGKAQEIQSALAESGLPIMLHSSVQRMTEVYRAAGMDFPHSKPFEAASLSGHVVICPPAVAGGAFLRKIKNARTAMISGWGIDANMAYRWQCDAVFPLSDHADYDDLLRHVEQVAPERVLTLHGFAAEFARDLRSRGIEAWALTGPNQLELEAIVPVPDLPQESAENEVLPDSEFARFAGTAEAVRQTSGKLSKIRLVAGLLADLPPENLAPVAAWLTGRPLGQGVKLQVGWAVIKQALLAVSGIEVGAFRAISSRHRDAGLTARDVMRGRSCNQGLSFAEVIEGLTRLSHARGPSAKAELLGELLRQASSLEAMYLVKILTGDLRIGLKEGLVEDAISTAFAQNPAEVREAGMLLGDIAALVTLASQRRLAEASIQMFRAIKPMLASPEPDAEAIWDRLGGSGSVWVEPKMDGVRAQLHFSGGRGQIFSRDLKDLSDTFPELIQAGLSWGESAIFDAEILAFQDGRPLGFFELQKRLGRRERDFFLAGEIPVVCRIFDLLSYASRSLLREPLSQRRQMLQTLSLPEPFAIIPVTSCDSPAAIDRVFAEARASGHEGLMAKDPTSPYTPGRRGLAWLKLKKAWSTLDVVVVAAEYGHGRRHDVLSDYTFAVKGAGGKLLTIGKAYSGLTDAEILELTEVFKSLAIAPLTSGKLSVKPEVVLEIAFDSIQESDRHSSGLALRFPRIKAIRRDKTPADIDTIQTARKLLPRKRGEH